MTTKTIMSNKSSDLPLGAWLTVALLFVVGLLNYLDRTMITTMRSSIIEAIPMTETQFGLLTSVFLWTYGLLSPFAGYMADKFKRSRVVIVSLFVWSGVTLLTSYSKTYEQLLATRVLMGISEACYIPAALALISDYHKTTTRSLATGIHMTGIMIGSSLGFLGGWLAETYQWHTAFMVFGAFGIVYTLVSMFLLKDPPPEISDSKSGNKTRGESVSFFSGIEGLFKIRSFNIMLIYWGVLGIVTWLVTGWLPTFYKEHFNLSQTVSGFYATAYLYPASIAGLLVSGFIADRWSKTNSRARILVPAIALCVGAPCILAASFVPIIAVVIVLFMIYAFNKAFTDSNMMPMLCLVVDPRYRATGYGVLNFFGTIIGGVGLYMGGVLRDAHIDLSIMFRIAAVAMIICGALLFSIRPKKLG
ncbi:MAG: MFS transporter [Bacteroidales bacterium]|jgi:MFS family permease|nr:MFS transporter [Bacteroidales bacterium]